MTAQDRVVKALQESNDRLTARVATLADERNRAEDLAYSWSLAAKVALVASFTGVVCLVVCLVMLWP